MVPMRTMPLAPASSVDVSSTARAQRRHRSVSTEAVGRRLDSMLCRTEEPREPADARSESDGEKGEKGSEDENEDEQDSDADEEAEEVEDALL